MYPRALYFSATYIFLCSSLALFGLPSQRVPCRPAGHTVRCHDSTSRLKKNPLLIEPDRGLTWKTSLSPTTFFLCFFLTSSQQRAPLLDLASYHVGAHIVSKLGFVPSSHQFTLAVEELRRQYRVQHGLYVPPASNDAGGGGGGGLGIGSISLDGLQDRLRTLHGWLQRTMQDSPAPDDSRGVIEMFLEAEQETTATQIVLIDDNFS